MSCTKLLCLATLMVDVVVAALLPLTIVLLVLLLIACAGAACPFLCQAAAFLALRSLFGF